MRRFLAISLPLLVIGVSVHLDTRSVHSQYRSYDVLEPGSSFGRVMAGPTLLDSVRIDRTATLEIPMDRVPTAVFFLAFEAGSLDVEMTSPSGDRVGPDTEASEERGYVADDERVLGMLPGRFRIIYLTDPEPGTWEVVVTAREIPDSLEWVPFVLTSLLQPGAGINLRVLVPEAATPRGEPLPIRASIDAAGEPVIRADVTAMLISPDGRKLNVPLRDDGAMPDSVADDGLYTGRLERTDQAGEYMIFVTAERRGGQDLPDFSRSQHGLTFVSTSRSRLEGELRDRGVDENDNGFFERVDLEFGIHATQTGRYRVVAWFLDSNGNSVSAGEIYELGPGTHRLALPIEGEWFVKHRSKGPLRLDRLLLIEEREGESIGPLLEERRGGLETETYDADRIETKPIRIIGLSKLSQVDRDADGLFEVLHVEVDVFVNQAGSYRWSTNLVDWDGNVIVRMTGAKQGQLKAGPEKITLEYPGNCIRGLGIDGEYLLESLSLFGPAGTHPGARIRLGKLFDHEEFAPEASPADRESRTRSLYECNY